MNTRNILTQAQGISDNPSARIRTSHRITGRQVFAAVLSLMLAMSVVLAAARSVIAASRPQMLGGDPELAHKELTQAMDIAPDYLMTKVLYAQYYARQVNDARLFRQALTEVMAADPTTLEDQVLANTLAQRRAKILLEKERHLF